MSTNTRRRSRGSKRPLLLLSIVILIAAGVSIYLAACGRMGASRTPVAVSAPTVQPEIELPERPSEEPRQTPPEDVPSVKVTEIQPEDRATAEVHVDPAAEEAPKPEELVIELRQGVESSGKVALTFDAGASSKPTPKLLSILSRNGVRATFFLTGKWVNANPELARQIVADGHEIGNHSYTHPDMREISDDKIREELSRTEELIRSVTGASTKPYFRAPFGARDARVLQVAAEEGYRNIHWTVDSWDGFKKGIEASEIMERVLTKTEDGAIVLMHCGSWPTVEALPEMIRELRGKGYDLVGLSELTSE